MHYAMIVVPAVVGLLIILWYIHPYYVSPALFYCFFFIFIFKTVLTLYTEQWACLFGPLLFIQFSKPAVQYSKMLHRIVSYRIVSFRRNISYVVGRKKRRKGEWDRCNYYVQYTQVVSHCVFRIHFIDEAIRIIYLASSTFLSCVWWCMVFNNVLLLY